MIQRIKISLKFMLWFDDYYGSKIPGRNLQDGPAQHHLDIIWLGMVPINVSSKPVARVKWKSGLFEEHF